MTSKHQKEYFKLLDELTKLTKEAISLSNQSKYPKVNKRRLGKFLINFIQVVCIAKQMHHLQAMYIPKETGFQKGGMVISSESPEGEMIINKDKTFTKIPEINTSN